MNALLSAISRNSFILCLLLSAVDARPPVRVPSFGPNGTHWPEQISTPFLYDASAHDIEVACNWVAIRAALVNITDEQANAGTRILVQPGVLNGIAGDELSGVGSLTWTK